MKVSNLQEFCNRHKLSDPVLLEVDGVLCEVKEIKRVKSDNIRYLNQSKLVLVPALPELL